MSKFINFLSECNGGKLLEDIDSRFEKLLDEIEKVNSEGKFSLALSIVPSQQGTVFVKPTMSEKRPIRQRPVSEFFLTCKGLTKEDPRQLKLTENLIDIKKS